MDLQREESSVMADPIDASDPRDALMALIFSAWKNWKAVFILNISQLIVTISV